jgi:hypothetical protein
MSRKSQGQAVRLKDEQEGSRTHRKVRGQEERFNNRQNDARNEQEDSRASRSGSVMTSGRSKV